MYTNKQIINLFIKKTGVENDSQLAAYLSEKYGAKITRQNIAQFKSVERSTLTHLLLREALEVST